jgi:hypothetical protein
MIRRVKISWDEYGAKYRGLIDVSVMLDAIEAAKDSRKRPNTRYC